MDGSEIFKTSLKIAAWIAGFVIVPVLTALGLSKIFNWDYKFILFYFAIFYVGCFIIAFLMYFLRDYIRKQIKEVLKEEKLINSDEGIKK